MQEPLLLNGKKLTLELWLDNCDLSQFKSSFVDMRLGELLSYSDKDIQDLCKEFNIKMPFKKRLADAIHVLQANKNKIEMIDNKKSDGKNSKNKNKNKDTPTVMRTIISAEEEKAFDEIQERYKDILQSIAYVNDSIGLLKKNHAQCKQQINKAFDDIIHRLNNRRQQLLERLNFEGNKKMTVIKNDKEKLIEYKRSCEEAKQDANNLAMDLTMPKIKRKENILKIRKYVYKYAKTHEVHLSTEGYISDNYIHFDYKSDAAKRTFKFVSTYGAILIKEKPLAPMLKVIGFGITSCKIGFKMNPNSNPYVDKPKEWIIEYKKYKASNIKKPNPVKKSNANKQLKKTKNNQNAIDKYDVSDDDDDDDDQKAKAKANDDDLNIDDIGAINENQWRPIAKLEDVNTYLIKNLSGNTTYSVRVICSNDNGWSEYSKIVNFTTKKIEGGVDSRLMNVKEKKRLIQMIADKLDAEREAKLMDANQNQPKKNKRQSSGLFGGLFGGGKPKNRFVNEDNIDLQLIYRASRDGYEAQIFHDKCDYVNNTLIVIEAKENRNLFGGFTKIQWKSPNNFAFVHDPNAFLFLLKSTKTKDKPEIFRIKKDEIKYAVCHDKDYGPIFGNGYSLCLYNKCNEVNKNYTNPVSFNFRSSPNQLSGEYNFTVKDYEVFQLHLKK